jgi:hypothetical protein
MHKDILFIANQFNIQGSVSEYHAITTGHINDSYLIRTDQSLTGYFLQWINSYIFKDVEGLMKNIEIVTNHLSKKNESSESNESRVLELILTYSGSTYYLDDEGEYWRMYRNIPGTHVYDFVENEHIAYEGGKAFGRFMSDLADLPAELLTETIPDFHNMEIRIRNFQASVAANPFNRKKYVLEEIAFVEKRAEEMLRIPQMIREGILPKRITHNDTKFNNILFNESNKAICIVDLDTVMPGSILFDFGDAIRTGANTAFEDEKDLEKVNINLPIFEAYTKGFIEATKLSLHATEIDMLAFSARFMTFIIGLRFLTDYIDGDPYFRTNYPEHNLDRARVQFRLIESMEDQAGKMEEIILNFCNVHS